MVERAERLGFDVRFARWRLAALPENPTGFVVSRLLETSPEGADLIIAKSLGCRAAAHAARMQTPAVWMTPVLTDPEVAAGIADNPAPQLVVAGSRDPMHDSTAAAGLGCAVLELSGLDHALSATGDFVVPDAILEQIAGATDDFLRRLP
ncbi:hypothetical protein [Nocardioides sp.]|uniref:hypothetical protein n=1 Tax=Nocardioides sp. TaxID=35761 RepID=UPI002B273575|nr:hypothetical protein [Nocardioides sp.]